MLLQLLTTVALLERMAPSVRERKGLKNLVEQPSMGPQKGTPVQDPQFGTLLAGTTGLLAALFLGWNPPLPGWAGS